MPPDIESSSRHFEANLENEKELKEKLEDVELDIVVHLAAQIRGNPPQVMNTNVLGTVNLLEVLHDKNPKLVIVASTAAQLYRNAQYNPIDERHPITPVTTYGMSKQLMENVVNFYHRVNQTPTLIFRQSNVYGKSIKEKSTVINKFIEIAENKGKITVYGDGTQVRNFIHIEDLLEFYMRAINSKKPGVLAGETMNIGGLEEYQIKEIAEMVADASGNVEIENVQGEIPSEKEVYLFNLSIEKAKALLDYEPQISVREGIERMCGD